MSLFHRNKPDPKPCPQCAQLLESDALVCDMCGLDLREAQPVTAGAPAATAEEQLDESR
jgi:predicted amidophosphoribosyltransferase